MVNAAVFEWHVFEKTAFRHPDKSKDPNAAVRFLEIKQSYELLIDEYRRKLYDEKGITEDAFHKGDHPSHFQPFSATQGARFNFHEEDIRFFHDLSINTRWNLQKFSWIIGILNSGFVADCLTPWFCLRAKQSPIWYSFSPIGVFHACNPLDIVALFLTQSSLQALI